MKITLVFALLVLGLLACTYAQVPGEEQPPPDESPLPDEGDDGAGEETLPPDEGEEPPDGEDLPAPDDGGETPTDGDLPAAGAATDDESLDEETIEGQPVAPPEEPTEEEVTQNAQAFLSAPGSTTCARLLQAATRLDNFLYHPNGTSISAAQIPWSQVQSLLAPGFRYNDYSLFPSAGTYTNYQRYWRALNAVHRRYRVVSIRNTWTSCDPVQYKLFFEWRETFRSVRTGRRATSTSLYVYEFNENFRVTRQAYWTSSNIRRIL